MMTILIPISYNYASRTVSDSGLAIPVLFPRCKFTAVNVVHRKCNGRSRLQSPRTLHFRVHCQSSKTEKVQIRRCSPFLESSLLSSNGSMTSDEWKAVPDIWRSSAEKYGDRVALVDPYHDPPSTMTYKELEQAILDFCEGLRVIGVRPDEKLALFADNSSRWLVADQGMMASGAINVVRGSRSSVEELLQIYNHSESVALAVDNPELFNRIEQTFYSKASMRFIILLWGEKSTLISKGNEEVPVFSFTEVIELGCKGRKALFDSHDDNNKHGLLCYTKNGLESLHSDSSLIKGLFLSDEQV